MKKLLNTTQNFIEFEAKNYSLDILGKKDFILIDCERNRKKNPPIDKFY